MFLSSSGRSSTPSDSKGESHLAVDKKGGSSSEEMKASTSFRARAGLGIKKRGEEEMEEVQDPLLSNEKLRFKKVAAGISSTEQMVSGVGNEHRQASNLVPDSHHTIYHLARGMITRGISAM